MNKTTHPPRLGVLLLEAVLPARQAEDIIGDLTEVFFKRLSTGRRGVRLWFWCQTLFFALSFRSLNRSAARNKPRLPSQVTRHPESRIPDMIGMWTRGRQTARRLCREWRYSVSVILIFGIGIGPAAAMLSVVQRVLLQPLAYDQPERLGLVRIDLGELHAHPGAALSEITDLRGVEGLFAGVEATSREFELSLGEGNDLMPLTALRVTPGLFEMLGVAPILGRHFTEEDSESPMVIMSHGLWTTHFGGDPAILGRTVTLNGMDVPVIGIMPAGFGLHLGRGSQLSSNVDVWTPLDLQPHRAFWGFPTLVRLADGVSFDQANAGLEAFTQSLTDQYPEVYANTNVRFTVHALLPDLVRQAQPAIHAALAGVLLLLVIAIANGTALVMARVKAREVDFAVRTAIGAGRWALVQDVLAENTILTVSGIAVGGVLAAAGMVGLRSLIPETVPRSDSIVLGWELLGYSALLGFVGLSLAGLIPALKAARGTPLQLLRGDGGQRGSTRATGRSVLVGTQVAIAVVLSFAAVQLARSAFELGNADLHYDAENVLAFTVPVDGTRFQSWEEQLVFHHELRDRLKALPGVRAVGAVSHLPLGGRGPVDAFGPGTVGDTVDWHDPLANYFAVLPGYLESIGVQIRGGRDLTDVDNLEARAVAVIDESLAEMAWPGEDPIGKTMRMGWELPVATVVGVISHPRVIDVSQEVRPQIYVPFGLFRWSPLSYTLRAERDPTPLIGAVRDVLAEMGPGRAASGFRLLEENVAASMSTLRFASLLVSLLAFSAALLSALGLYAVVSYVVNQQRRATAIRGAMGATPSQLLRHHLGNGAGILVVAVPIGLALSLISARFVESLLYGVDVRDFVSLSAAASLAAVTGVIGTLIPARSAAKADPARALRME